MIPLLHDLSDEPVLVFGGGPVGARKARRFDREARVVVLSPTFADADFGGAELVRAAPDAASVSGWIDRADPVLVVTATDDESLNAAVAEAAEAAGVLVNRTDRSGDRSAGSVVVPATVRDGPVTVAVATDGTSPALSGHLRERFEDDLEGVGELARATGEVRERLQSRGVPPAERRETVRALVRSPAVWTALGSGDTNLDRVVTDVLSEIMGDAS